MMPISVGFQSFYQICQAELTALTKVATSDTRNPSSTRRSELLIRRLNGHTWMDALGQNNERDTHAALSHINQYLRA